ncbi:MAG: thioredoxin domain-containing protein [Proteobacteria bacterium]|nr:thioredoxin domain-containing protein [Pseudomonadota bacterium]
MGNRLAAESSPYLLQHKDNPVDWFPWGDEAFELAKKLDKPIFISIGYAACHWCHVMAHESFENPEIAQLMNKLFVNIKIDREERPDVDSIYMNAIQVVQQSGGWPLSAFCTPEGKPYFLGTYFPPTEHHGRPGFPQILVAMSRVFAEERHKVEHNVAGIMDGLHQIDQHFRRSVDQADPGLLVQGLLIKAGRALTQRSDPVHGGLGSRPKFPSSSSHDLLGRAGRLRLGKPAREAFLLQAKKMARGGIYDHLGGGFARYSVDERWLVPHFEKMLYDNGQLLGIYGDAYAMTGEEEYARVIDETITWLHGEMMHSSGGLYASQDADSEGEEGKFYVWTPMEVRDVLGAADAIFFETSYGVTDRGNFENNTTVLSRITELGSDSEEAALADMRQRMFTARKERIAPDTDTKILAAWNGLALSGLIRAWSATGNQRALDLATTVGNFLASEMLYEGGEKIWRVYKDGKTKLEGTIDDYAFCARAFLQMAEATGEEVWWQRGTTLMAAVRERFYEEQDGVGIFFMTPVDGSERLIHRPESNSDGALPSGAAIALECMLRLGHVAGDERAQSIAENYLIARGPQMGQSVFASSRLLSAVDIYLNGIQLVVSDGDGSEQLLTAARRAYAPTLVVAGRWATPSLLRDRGNAADGRALAYVCQGQTCAAPVSEPDELRALLERTPQ